MQHETNVSFIIVNITNQLTIFSHNLINQI